MSKTNGTVEPVTVVVRESFYDLPGVGSETGRSYRITRVEDFLDPSYWRRNFEGRTVDVRQGASRYVQDVLTLRYLPPEIRNPLRGLPESYVRDFRTSAADRWEALWLADMENGVAVSEVIEWKNEEQLFRNAEAALEVMGLSRLGEDGPIRRLVLALVFAVAVTVRAATVTAMQNAVRAVAAGDGDRFRRAQFQILHMTPFEENILVGRLAPTVDDALIFRAGVEIDGLAGPAAGPQTAPGAPAASGTGGASASAITAWDISSYAITAANEPITALHDDETSGEILEDRADLDQDGSCYEDPSFDDAMMPVDAAVVEAVPIGL